MELATNQSALILEASEEGEISVHVASPDPEGLSCALCQAIATRLTQDETFQAELIELLEQDLPDDH